MQKERASNFKVGKLDPKIKRRGYSNREREEAPHLYINEIADVVDGRYQN